MCVCVYVDNREGAKSILTSENSILHRAMGTWKFHTGMEME